MKTDPVIKDAMKHLTEISADREALELARIRERAEMDLATSMARVLKKGIKKGRAEVKLEVLKALLLGPETSSLPDAEIARTVGVTQDQVAAMRKSLQDKSR